MAKEKEIVSMVSDGIVDSLRTTILSLYRENGELMYNKLKNLLIRRHVISCDGIVDDWRFACLLYLEEIIPYIDEKDLMTIGSDEFFERFIFSPLGKKQSLYSQTKDRSPNELLLLFDEYGKSSGKSPYEKAEAWEIKEFLSQVDCRY